MGFSVFLKGIQGLRFGPFRKPNHNGYLKSGWRKGRKSHFKSRPKSPQCVSTSPGDVDFPAARREDCFLKSCAPVAGGLAVVSSDDFELALVGLSLVEVDPELPQQVSVSGSMHATAEALVSPTEAALMSENTQTRLSTPVSTMPRIGDLILSFVPPMETPVSLADASSAMVSVHPVGVGAVPAKEGEPVKTASAKGLQHRGFLGSRKASSSLPGMKEASSSTKGSKVVVKDS